MDPIAGIFASYLDVVSDVSHNYFSEMMGTEVTSLIVEHQGIRVPYLHQLWRIREKSVCSTYSGEVGKYSQCTTAARSLFFDICMQLQGQRLQHWKQKKLKNMYCNAAVSFTPTVATLKWSGTVSPLDEARSECNTATAELMGNTDPAVKKHKEQVCSEYRKLRNKENK